MTLFERYLVACADGTSDIYLHLPTLCRVVVSLDAKQVIELGVGGSGNSTLALLAGVSVTDGQVWSCDINGSIVPEYLHADDRWTFAEGDSLKLLGVAPKSADVLFIDSEHTYEQTLGELRAYVPRVRRGGVVLLHDTGGHQPGVRRALDEFCAAQQLVWHDSPECYGLGRIDIP